jgi:hypothetical protein
MTLGRKEEQMSVIADSSKLHEEETQKSERNI